MNVEIRTTDPKAIAEAIVWQFAKTAFFGMAAIATITIAAEWISPTPVDDTDLSARTRSGFRLKMDFGTGCQYLVTSAGSITPRLDKAGHAMCGGSQP